MTGHASARAAALIRQLTLRPHPEGGHFAEVFRSTSAVTADDGRRRPALTTIYYLLAAGDVSRWHRVRSDEVWHFYEGDPLDIFVLDEAANDLTVHRLGPAADATRPAFTVPAGHWQAARTTGAYSLLGCTVGPGFDFADFTLARDVTPIAALIRSHHPPMSDWL